MFDDLRTESLAELAEIGFAGYAVGGLSVGEPKDEMNAVLAHIAPRLPADKPRYLMGVGTPQDLLRGVALGIDLFDCVLPTRNARNGYLFTSRGIVKIRNAGAPRRPRAHRFGVRLLCLRPFLARLSASSGQLRRNARRHADDHPQSALLPPPDGRIANCH